ncbi:MAG TPA: TIGR03032 family protein [Thermoleophilaceae bacterium]|nr:TIGR03032 family protein [Thermoleophilaceae bacterium]
MRPVFIVAAPGSGGPQLRDALAASPELTLLDQPGHELLEAEPDLHPANRGWDSNRLAAGDSDAAMAGRLRAAFAGRPVVHSSHDTLRVPFLHAVFPEATFVFLHRDPAEAVPAALADWQAGRAVTYPDLPGWDGLPWSFVLTPGWRAFKGEPAEEVAAAQWEAATRIAVGELQRLPPERFAVVDHAALAGDPPAELGRLWEFLGVAPGQGAGFRPAPAGDPSPGLETALARTADTALVARGLFAAPPDDRPAEQPLRSVSTTSLAALLDELGASLLVSTYQTNKVVVARRAGRSVNTHFRAFDGPMGMAHRDGRLAIGTRAQVHEYRDVPAAVERLGGPVDHDACFIPRSTHHTGDVRIHDVAFAGDELWFVATRFSCLATLDHEHSFVPRWTPPFITELAAEDRCHLNGLCAIGDEVRYVTALGASDEPGGWRERRADGGVVMDVPSGQIVASGLSMPHSPRWHRDRLWILESGQGGLGTLDPATGEYEEVAQVPGFTRGLSFHGSLAFIGLSQIREATTFGGLPLTARLEERQCGVWVVDIDSGRTVALLRFEDLVQELFEVLLLPGVRFPEIAAPGDDAATGAFVLPD